MEDSPVSESAPESTAETPPKRRRHCSACGLAGHRFDTCPNRPAGMNKPPRRPTTLADRARAAGREPEPQTKPRAGERWAGPPADAKGFEGLALTRLDRLGSEVSARTRGWPVKLEDATPLTEVLAEWKTRYGLTPEESESLFNVATDALPSFRLAELNGVTGDVIHARGVAVAAKTDSRSVTHAALALVREALVFSTFDWEKKSAKREEPDNDDDL